MKKYYFKGNSKKGKSLIDRLIELGGKSYEDWIDGTNRDYIYYITSNYKDISYCKLSYDAINNLRKKGYVDISPEEEPEEPEEINNYEESLIDWEQREYDLAKELLISLLDKNGVKNALDLSTGVRSVNYDSVECNIDLSIKIARDFISKLNE